MISLVETALISLEEKSLLVTKGAKDYFFLSTIVALVKAHQWPTQAIVYRQQVVERILAFAQALFSRHAGCEHLGPPGMGSFKNNQVAAFTSAPAMVPIMPNEFDPGGMLPPPHLGVTVSLDPSMRSFWLLTFNYSRPVNSIPFWRFLIGRISQA